MKTLKAKVGNNVIFYDSYRLKEVFRGVVTNVNQYFVDVNITSSSENFYLIHPKIRIPYKNFDYLKLCNTMNTE